MVLCSMFCGSLDGGEFGGVGYMYMYGWVPLLFISNYHNIGNWLCCCCSVTQSCPTLCDHMDSSMPGFPVFHYLPEFAQTHVHWVSDAIQWSHPLLPTSPPAINLSEHQRLFQWVGSLHQVTKVLELQLEHQSFQWIFRADFLKDWLAWSPCSPRTLKSLLQHQNSKVSVLQCSAIFVVQLWHPFMTTEKTTALTLWTFGQVTYFFFNMLCRFGITFLPRTSYHLQWSWSPRKENLSLLSFSSLLFAMKCWDRILWS